MKRMLGSSRSEIVGDEQVTAKGLDVVLNRVVTFVDDNLQAFRVCFGEGPPLRYLAIQRGVHLFCCRYPYLLWEQSELYLLFDTRYDPSQ